MRKRAFLQAASVGGLVALTGLGGCATLTQLSVEVRSFGEWPAGRAPGRYAFDRLPSQEAAGEAYAALEAAASQALQAAGFQPAPAGTEPDVLVQVGGRSSRADPAPWDDPLWWGGGLRWRLSAWRGPYWGGPYWGGPYLGSRWGYNSGRFDHEVALLLRDRATGKPLYEARASNEGFSRELIGVAVPLMSAALHEFPAIQPAPHQVRVPM